MKWLAIGMVVLVISLSHSYGQHTPQWSFIKTGTEQKKIIDIQAIGSVTFVAGLFADSLVADSVVLKADSLRDIFLISLNDKGKVMWCNRYGGKGDDTPSQLATDGMLLYLSGIQTDSVSIKKEGKSNNATMFVKALTEEGEEKWNMEIRIKGEGSIDVLTPGPDNLLLVGGMFSGSITLKDKQYYSSDGTRTFSLLISSDGTPVQCSVSEGSGRHRLVATCFDRRGNQYQMLAVGKKSNLILPMQVNKQMYFPTEGIVITKTGEDSDNWILPVECSGFIEGVNLHCDEKGVLYAGLNYNSSFDVNGFSSLPSENLTSSIVVITPQGSIDTIRQITGYKYCRMMDFRVGKEGSIMMAGYQYGGFSEVSSLKGTLQSTRGTYIAEMSNTGKLIWHDELSNDINYGRAVAFDNVGNLLLAGGFRASMESSQNKSSQANSRQVGMYVRSYHLCRESQLDMSVPQEICEGDTLFVSAPDGYREYVWNGVHVSSNLYTISKPGKIVLEAYDGFGCKATDSIIVVLKPLSEAGLGCDTTLYPGDVLSLVVDSSCSQYKWGDGYTGRGRSIPYSFTSERISLAVTVTSQDHCPSTDTINIAFKNAISTLGESFKVFPIPTRDILYWSFDDGSVNDFTIDIIDPRGIIVFSQEYTSSFKCRQNSINISYLDNGSYILRMQCADNVKTQIIVKQ